MVASNREGVCLFRVYLPHAQRVEVMGDFTNWRTNALMMHREPPGWWVASIEVPAGEHEFCYLVDESIWLADYGASGVHMSRDGHWLSSLVVREPVATASSATETEVKHPGGRPERRSLPRWSVSPDEPPRDPTPAPMGVF